MVYRLVNFRNTPADCVRKEFDDGLVLIIPFNPDNTDYVAYLAWVAQGNTPLPAEENKQ